jgi:uncharacterized membrane protein
MKITNQKVLFFGIVATLLFTIVVLSGFNIGFAGSVYSFLYLCIIPGFFVQRLLRMHGISFFESITYIVGFSIAYLLLIGIMTDLLVFLPSIHHPLSMLNSLIVFDIATILLIFINHFKGNTSLLSIALPKITFIQLFFYIIPCFLPILSVIGAQVLNNNGVNIFNMIFLLFISFYVLLVTIFLKDPETFSFEIPIYLIAVSLLFILSLRSSYIVGWDIYTEYRVFLLTESNQLWSMANYTDAYNACLSITILPTLFHYFTKVDNPFVFKVLFQCIFALTPITIYSLAKKFANRLTAFFCAFFFMSTIDFFRELPALIRQEIAYLFFGLLLLTLFNKQIAPLQKKILFIIFSFSIVLSHYSTAYVVIILFIFSCIFLVIYTKISHKFFHILPEDFTMKPLPIILLIIFAALWLVLITNTAGNIVSTLSKTGSNITNFGQKTLNTSIIDQLAFPRVENSQGLLTQEISEDTKVYNQYNFSYYPASTYKGYSPTIIDNDILPLHVSDLASNIIYFIGNSVTKILKVLIILGFIGTIILFRKKFFSAEYCILSIGFAIALLLITSVPAISLFYPIGRLDQQTLFLIALPALLSIYWLLRFIPYRVRVLLIALLLVLYALFTNTFVSQLVGGQDPEIILNNSGLYYNEVYLHSSELASIHWLDANNKEHLPIFADIGSNEKMHGYSNNKYVTTYMDVFPSFIAQNGYVYSSYANTLYGIGITNPNDTRMEYNFPNEFLNANKNLIYSNHYTKIYK